MSENDWSIVANDYRSYLRIERSLSPNTVNSYLSDIAKFSRFLGPVLPAEVSSDDISSFLVSMHESEISKRSQSRMISSLRSFFDFLQLEGKIETNPCEKIDSPKLNRYIPVVLSVEEIDRIISSVDLSEPEGHRNKAIFEMLYSCGLRVSELISLRISDLFFEDAFIRIIGKGNKQRLVPIGEPAMDAVNLYISQSRRKYTSKSEDVLFLNRRGGKLTREMIFLIVKKQAETAGIRKNVSPHTFRHSFATHLVGNGADLRVVQEMLGHESILTTEIYTHIDSEKWRESIIKYHPRG